MREIHPRISDTQKIMRTNNKLQSQPTLIARQNAQNQNSEQKLTLFANGEAWRERERERVQKEELQSVFLLRGPQLELGSIGLSSTVDTIEMGRIQILRKFWICWASLHLEY